MATNAFDYLPHVAAVNIFKRLPVKSLIRSTSVSKSWYSLINNPTFISAHMNHSLSCCYQNAVLVIPMNIEYNKYCALISADNGDVLKQYNIPFKTKTGTLKMCGSFNGILCLNEIGSQKVSGYSLVEDYQELYLWNPCVGKHRTLSWSCFKKLDKQSYAIGFGIHEPNYDFRLVRVVYPECEMDFLLQNVLPKVEVYSLRSNKWRRIHDPVVPTFAFKCGITVGNNMTYWLNTKMSRRPSENRCILWFDFNKEVFGKIEIPDHVLYCFGLMGNPVLMKFEGKLAFCVTKSNEHNQPCSIWLMSHEDGIVSWNLRFKTALKGCARPLSLSRGGTLLMVAAIGSVEGLVSCNLMSEDLRQIKPLVTEPGYVDTSFLESLLMLEGRDELLKSAK